MSDLPSRKRPAFQFYPADWRKDVELRSCSIAARGLWIDMLCIAHECEPYGHLVVNGRAMTPAQIAGQVGLSAAQCKALVQELLDNGVARCTDEGVIYSKRMVDDERVRNARAEGGKAGSEHGVKGAEHGKKGGRPPSGRGVSEPPSEPPKEPPPSSSSSSSTASTPPSVEKASRKRSPPPACPEDVAEQVWADFLQLRAAKKAPVTATVVVSARSESAKAGMTLEAFLSLWCARGSQGLQASWLKEDEVRAGRAHQSFRERDVEAKRAEFAAWSGGLMGRDGVGECDLSDVIDMEESDAPRLLG